MGCWFAYSSLDSTFFFAALHHKHCGGSEAKKNETSKHLKWTFWLVVSTHLKNVTQNGNLPQIGVKIPKIFELHHLDFAEFGIQ